MRRRLLLAVALSAACASTAAEADPRRPAGFATVTEGRILFFPPSVEVYEIGAGGPPLLKQDWTETARQHVREALETMLTERKATLIAYRDPEASDRRLQHLQIARVLWLVSQAILQHSYGPDALRLPNKAGRFDWTLGPSASALREDNDDADYALFVTFLEGHSTGGRVAMNVASAVLGGVMVTGRQRGIASLVDLRTGDIVWYHKNDESDGDLRTAASARKAIERLLKGFPF